MNVKYLNTLNVFKNVIVFAEQPWSVLAGVSQGFKDRVAALKAVSQELDGLLGNHAAGVARNILEDENHKFYRLEHVYLMPVIRVARAVGRTVPGVKNLLATLPARISKRNILATARGVLNATAAHGALLAANGLPADFREKLASAIQDVENRQQLTTVERQEAVRITKAINSANKRGQQEVACMDPIVRMLCRDNSVDGPEVLRAWSTARRTPKVGKQGEGAQGSGTGPKDQGPGDANIQKEAA